MPDPGDSKLMKENFNAFTLGAIRQWITVIFCIGLISGCATMKGMVDQADLMVNNAANVTCTLMQDDGNLAVGDICKGVKPLLRIPLDEEIQIGQTLAAQILGASGLANNKRQQRYINQVGMWVALQSDRADELPWTFAVIDDDTINAFSVPGGYVFITRGMLSTMESESELAGALGHEIGHVVHRHHLNAIRKSSALKISSTGFLSLVEIENEKGELLTDERKESIANISTGLFVNGLGKGEEFEADRSGVILAARAGYDPYGMVLVLHKLERMDKSDSRLSLLFKSHPEPTDRLAALGKGWPEYLDTLQNSKVLTGRYQKYVLSDRHQRFRIASLKTSKTSLDPVLLAPF